MVFSQVIINDDYFQMSSFHGRLQWSSLVESSVSAAFEVASMWLDWDKNKVTVRWCEIILGPACVTVLGIREVSMPLVTSQSFALSSCVFLEERFCHVLGLHATRDVLSFLKIDACTLAFIH